MEALTHLGIGLFPFQISRLPPATKLRRSLSSSQVTTVCSASRWADRLLSDFNFTTDSSSSSVATATLVTPPLSIDRPERHVPIPIDFYQVLGAETHFLTDGIRRAFEARVSKPPQFGFSDDALISRRQILQAACETLSNPRSRREYNESLLDDEEATVITDVPWDKVPGALCVLQEAGETEVVLRVGEALLKERLPKSFKQDVVLVMALAFVDISRDAMALDPPDFITGYEFVEEALKLLQEEGASSLAPDLRAQIDETLEEITPRYVLELLGLPLGDDYAGKRRDGLSGVRNILWSVGGGGASAVVGGLTREKFMNEAFLRMTASEQVDLFVATPSNIPAESFEVYEVALASKRTMERATLSPSLNQSYLLSPSRASTTRLHSFCFSRNLSPSTSSIKLQRSSSSVSSSGVSLTRCNAVLSNSSSSKDVTELADIDWDNIGFGLKPTDYMYVMKCNLGGEFSNGELQRFGNIEVSPSAGVLNYGQGLFEGMKAYRKQDGKNILLFRPEENATRMRCGAERMCMPSPTIDQFVDAVKATVLANKRWVPPPGKGSLYIRPLLMGTGAVLGLAPAPEYTFLVYVSPVGNYFKEGVSPINLIVESEFHRATPGGTGGVKTIGNYAAVLKAQSVAKAKGYSDVLYLDCIYKRYLEEVSSCNIFIVKDNVVSTPEIRGTILPGITRKSIVDVARSQGLKVEERNVTVDELLEADEVFCTGTAVVVSPVGSITYKGKRVSYGEGSFGPVSEKLYTVLTSLQMGLTEDNMKWTVNLS